MIPDDIGFVWYTLHTVYIDFGGVSENETCMYIYWQLFKTHLCTFWLEWSSSHTFCVLRAEKILTFNQIVSYEPPMWLYGENLECIFLPTIQKGNRSLKPWITSLHLNRKEQQLQGLKCHWVCDSRRLPAVSIRLGNYKQYKKGK